METIYSKVLEIIKKYAIDKDKIISAKGDEDIVKDLRINSARIVDIILDVEEEYNLNVSDHALQKIKTINDIVTFIQDQKK
jgi:acyl carrier protein